MGGGQPGDKDMFLQFWEKQSKVVEERLSSHDKPFVAGTDRPTIADFKLFAQISFGFSHDNEMCTVPEDVQTEV